MSENIEEKLKKNFSDDPLFFCGHENMRVGQTSNMNDENLAAVAVSKCRMIMDGLATETKMTVCYNLTLGVFRLFCVCGEKKDLQNIADQFAEGMKEEIDEQYRSDMKLRKPKKNDQDLSQKAYELLLQFLGQKQEEHNIASAFWIGPMLYILSQCYEQSQVPFERCKEEILEGLEFYKYSLNSTEIS